ncbi:MAG TPA: RNA methyltransferase, partial [Saprospiraceae bacterium]|nr:RNA methyltransferase [Saprospiraceae bacterium]
CSGMGVLRRNPDAKWQLNKEFMDRVKLMQREILSQYSKMIKQDGQLVYATCSIFPSENQHQVQMFLESNQQFKLEAEQIILPSQSGFDGFYMARLKKN